VKQDDKGSENEGLIEIEPKSVEGQWFYVDIMAVNCEP